MAPLCHLMFRCKSRAACSEETLAEVVFEIPVMTDLKTPYLPPAYPVPSLDMKMFSFSGYSADKEAVCMKTPTTNKPVSLSTEGHVRNINDKRSDSA